MEKSSWILILIVIALGLVVFFSVQESSEQANDPTPEGYMMFTSDEFGFTFKYRSEGEDAYLLRENTVDLEHDPDYVYGIMLARSDEYTAFIEDPDILEGPPTIQIRIYENTQKRQPAIWIEEHPNASSFPLLQSDIEETALAGANAVSYVVDGLYTNDFMVAVHAGYVYVLSGGYADTASPLRQDFENILNSFEFIPIVTTSS